MRLPSLIAIAFIAAGCAGAGSLRPGASEAEVRGVMGPPGAVLPLADGSRQLAYPTAPFGTQTYMAHLSPEGRLVRVEQVLDDGRFQLIQPGMTRDELLRLIGPPGETARFNNLRQTAWDYRFRDTWGYTAILSVMLDDNGIVAGRIIQRIDRDRDKGMF